MKDLRSCERILGSGEGFIFATAKVAFTAGMIFQVVYLVPVKFFLVLLVHAVGVLCVVLAVRLVLLVYIVVPSANMLAYLDTTTPHLFPHCPPQKKITIAAFSKLRHQGYPCDDTVNQSLYRFFY